MPIFVKDKTTTPAAPPTPHRAKPRLPAAPALPKPGLRATAVGWQAATVAAGFLLGGGQVYGGAAPFGLALVLGCPGGHALAAAAGAVAGSLVLQPASAALPLCAAVLAALAGRWLGRAKNSYITGCAAACAALLAMQGAAAFLAGGALDAAQAAGALGTALLGAGCGAALRRLPAGKPASLCLWLAMFVACLQRFTLGGLAAPGLCLAAAAGLCCAFAGSLEQSAVLCVALAAAFTAAAPGQCYAALAVALGTLAAACLFPGERLRCAGAFAAGCGLGALAAPGFAAALPVAIAAGAGLLLFLACPIRALHAVFPPPAPPAAAQSLSAAARRLSGVADTLADIADTIQAVCTRQAPPKEENYEFVVEYAARQVCQGCKRRSQCWIKGYSTAVDGLYGLKPALESRGAVDVEDLPGPLTVCIHPSDLCAAATHGYRLWRSRRQTQARAATLRAALTEQYGAMASAMAQLAAKLGQAGLPDPRREEKAAALFRSVGLEPLECSVTADVAGRITVALTLPRTSLTPDDARLLADELGRICRRDFDLPDIAHCRTVTMLSFGERPLYAASFGLAVRPAPGEEVCGDACDQFCDNAGRAQMILCDGMGTGRPAAVDGRMAARLTGQLLRAGFAAESAARLVNVALGLKNGEQESGATLDLLTVDLFTGRAGLFKAGAAPSFLVRGGVPRLLEGPSLPMGILDSVVGRSNTFALNEGDLVVLVSDGALCDGSAWLEQQLTLSCRLGHTPAQIADTVADSAVRRATGHRDDITVAVLRLEKP